MCLYVCLGYNLRSVDHIDPIIFTHDVSSHKASLVTDESFKKKIIVMSFSALSKNVIYKIIIFLMAQFVDF